MKTIALVSQKGGSGKTTLAVHLAGCALHHGHTVALIDLDPQGSAFDWFRSRSKSEEFVATGATIGALPGLLNTSKLAGVELVILDSAPHSNKAAATAITHADLVLIPCRPSRFDLKAVQPTMDIVSVTNTPAEVILNCCARGNLAGEAREALRAQGFPVMELLIQQRVALSHSVINGQFIHEYEPAGAAANNIDELFRHIKERLKL